jgi:hypothetical protein
MSGPELERETFRDLEGNVLEGIAWPAPRTPPCLEMADDHRGPLDRDEDADWLEPDDPRRLEVERRRARAT